LEQTRKADEILVVNDGSTDNSQKILESFGNKIKLINIYPATGNKSHAQEVGLKHVKGDIFISTDGDTILDKNFIYYMDKSFEDDRVAAVGGYVKSIPYNWITACRAYDYIIGQNIHKLAQSKLDFMLVIPGAAGAFRTKIFNYHIGFDHDTLTEDLDFTYKLHRKKMKITYNRDAIVYTQDPVDIKSYVNQMRRWYGGGWQNLKKHLKADLIDDPRRVLELSLTYVEGLLFSILMFILPLVNIILTLKLLMIVLAITIVQSIYAAIREKRADILMVPLRYWLMMYVNSAVFLEQFFKEIFLKKNNLIWFHPARIEI
jgi:biofilm PGA synthesis N-glycosyltransferase PgaC